MNKMAMLGLGILAVSAIVFSLPGLKGQILYKDSEALTFTKLPSQQAMYEELLNYEGEALYMPVWGTKHAFFKFKDGKPYRLFQFEINDSPKIQPEASLVKIIDLPNCKPKLLPSVVQFIEEAHSPFEVINACTFIQTDDVIVTLNNDEIRLMNIKDKVTSRPATVRKEQWDDSEDWEFKKDILIWNKHGLLVEE